MFENQMLNVHVYVDCGWICIRIVNVDFNSFRGFDECSSFSSLLLGSADCCHCFNINDILCQIHLIDVDNQTKLK
jgi:hypothetical protein